MKVELLIVFLCSVLVLLLGFSIFDFHGFGITGNVVLSDTEIENVLGRNSVENFSRVDVMVAFNESYDIIDEMSANDFSVVYMNDSLIQARRVLEQVDYAEVLRGNLNGSFSDARVALRLIAWERLDYGDVMIYLYDVADRKERAFVIYDMLSIFGKSLNRYEAEGIEMGEVKEFFESAKISFYEDRYDEAEEFLEKTKYGIDTKRSEVSILGGLKRGLIGFFQRYRIYILVSFLLMCAIGFFSYKKISRYLLKKMIGKMKTEREVLNDLLKKLQISRFRDNSIPDLVYNIRLKKYQERLQRIKEELPVLEGRFAGKIRRINKHKNNSKK